MTPEDDDRTVIRPLARLSPAAPVVSRAPASAARADDRTLMPGEGPALPAQADMGNGLPVGTMLGEFELTQYIAEGGFGIVYLAYDHSLQRRVALKEYMPSSLASRSAGSQVSVKSERHRETFEAGRKSFVNEARLLASFDHPSLLKVYRFWEANGTAYMVMPFLEGITLKDRLRELGVPPDEAWLRDMLGPLTEALTVIHREQCFHRDIAPDNIMLLAGSNRALLMDFGASRRVIGDMTQALTVILKPGYAPVEQYAEIPGMKQGPWTDVYALAAVVYYAIVGKTPPPSVGRLLNDTYVPLAQAVAGRYSAGFLAAVDRALAVKPDERTPSIDRLRAEMGLVEGAPASAAAPPARSPASPGKAAAAAGVSAQAAPPKNKAVLAMAGAGVLVVGLAFGAYQWLSPAPRPASAASGLSSAAPAPSPDASPVASPVTAPVTAPGPAPVAATTPAPTPAPASPLATASPTAAPSPGGFNVAAEFDRVVAAQSPGFEVQAKANKSQLRIGRDELSFTVQSERDGFLYVQAHGSDGSLMLLYPNATSGGTKVRKGQTLKLPQPPIIFETTEPAGPTLLLVTVSARERDFSQLLPYKDGAYRVFPTGAKAQQIAAALPAARTPAQAGRVICAAAAATPCEDEFGAAVIKVEAVH